MVLNTLPRLNSERTRRVDPIEMENSARVGGLAGSAYGVLTGSPPNLTYTPAADFVGADSLRFRANDETADSDSAAVSIEVLPGTGGRDESLVAHWKLDDGAGSTASDSSGQGQDGTLLGGPAWAAGFLGGALDFDGTDDLVDAGSVLAQGTKAMTVAAWVFKRDAGDGRVVCKSTGTASAALFAGV